jgi:hypothetical protein
MINTYSNQLATIQNYILDKPKQSRLDVRGALHHIRVRGMPQEQISQSRAVIAQKCTDKPGMAFADFARLIT